MTIGEGDNYGQGDAGKAVKVYEKRTHDGAFKFRIEDRYGDGLCCTQGDGGYTLLYGEEELSSPFSYPKEEETLTFGDPSRCGVSWLCLSLRFTSTISFDASLFLACLHSRFLSLDNSYKHC